MRMMITFNFHLPQELRGDPQKAAHERGRTADEICRRALAAALEQHKSGGEFRIVPPRQLEPRAAASALGAAPVTTAVRFSSITAPPCSSTPPGKIDPHNNRAYAAIDT